MFVVKYRKIFYILTALLVLSSMGSIALFGLNFGIDFTGGSLVEIHYTGESPDKAILESGIASLSLGGFSLRQTGDSPAGEGYILRTQTLSEESRQAVFAVFSQNGVYQVTQDRLDTVGPIIGKELRDKAFVAIALVGIAIVLFIAFVFRKVSEPVSSWKYGIISIVALIHDIIIPVGVFSILGSTVGAEVNALFVMALLAILGYSINDTIVVFDRVRENLRLNREQNRIEDFELTVGKSLTQTYARSINTSLTTALALLTVFFFGPAATQDFALVMIVGVVAGAYSSIFLASPLLVTIAGRPKA
jgi:preprotein translocase subunit SecF